MGSKKSSSNPVKYYATFEQVICMAPADAIVAIKINDEIAYNTPIEKSTQFKIDAPNLFGGNKSEGGVSGACEARFGYPLQEKSDFLLEKTEELFSANRGVVSLVAKDFYMGQSPYAKPWHFRMKSTLLNYDYTDNWYREKATIAHTEDEDQEDSVNVTLNKNTGKYWRVISNRRNDVLYGYTVDTANEYTELSSGERMMWYSYDAATMKQKDSGALQVTHSRRVGSSNPYGGISYSQVTTPVKVLTPIAQNNYYDASCYGTYTKYKNNTADGQLTEFPREITARKDVSHNNTVWIIRRPISTTNVQYDFCLGTDEYRETGHFGGSTVYQPTTGNAGTGSNSDGGLIFTDGICVYQGIASSDTFTITGYKYVNHVIASGYGVVYTVDMGTLTSGDTVLAFAIDSENQTGVIVVKNDSKVYVRTIDNNAQDNTGNVVVGDYDSVFPNTEEDECYCLLSYSYIICICGQYVVTIKRTNVKTTSYDGSQLDYNPIHAIHEAITSPVWGLGKDAEVIDDSNFRAVADVLYNEHIGISFVFESDDKVSDFISDVLKIIGGVLRVNRSTGLVEIKLFRADYDTDDLLTFDASNVLSIRDVKRTALSECVNQVTIKYTNWETGEAASVVCQDLALLQQQGEPINADFDYPYVHWKPTALKLAQRDLYESGSQFLSCSITVGLQGRTLNLGDCIVLNFPHLGIENSVFRILKISYGGSASNEVEMDLVQDKFYMPSSTGYTSGGTPVTTIPVITQRFTYNRIIEMPYYVLYKFGLDPDSMLADSTVLGRMGVLVSAYNTIKVDSAEQYLTTDGNTYNNIGSIDKTDFVPSCVVNTALTQLSTVLRYRDGSNLSIVSVNQGVIGFIDDEIVGIGEIDPYDRTVTISRGLFDTVPAEHDEGAVMYIVTANDVNICNADEFTGGEIYRIKNVPVVSGVQADLNSSDELEIGFNIRAYRPYPPANVKIDSEYFPIMQNVDWYYGGECTWNNRNRLTQIADNYLLWTDAENVTVETNTVYNVNISNESGSILYAYSFDPTESSYNIVVPCDIEDYAKIEVFANRDNIYSLQSVVFEGDLQDLIMVASINNNTGELEITMNTNNPTTFEIVDNVLEVTCPADFHTTYSLDGDNLVRTYMV